MPGPACTSFLLAPQLISQGQAWPLLVPRANLDLGPDVLR